MPSRSPQRFRRHPDSHVTIAGAGPAAARPLGPGEPACLPARPVTRCVTGILAAIDLGAEFCVCAETAGTPAATSRDGFVGCSTSGSTGAPKRVRRSHASWIASFETNRQLFGLGPRDRYAIPGGLQHSLALYALVEAVWIGAAADILADLRPDRQWARLDGATVLYATPAQLRQICDSRERRETRPSVRLVLVGGGALDGPTRTALGDAFPRAEIRVFYGASETSFITLGDATDPAGSVGRPYPGVEIAIRDDAGNRLGPGLTGEIWVRSPYLFAGYAGDPGRDSRWQDGFLSVGEIGWFDPQGHLFLAGRRNRMFTVADQNVFPERIESALRALPGIVEAAVLPRPDRKRGQVPVAFLMAAAPNPDPDAIRRRLRQQLTPAEIPRDLIPLATWPRLVSGKTDYPALSALLDRPA